MPTLVVKEVMGMRSSGDRNNELFIKLVISFMFCRDEKVISVRY